MKDDLRQRLAAMLAQHGASEVLRALEEVALVQAMACLADRPQAAMDWRMTAERISGVRGSRAIDRLSARGEL